MGFKSLSDAEKLIQEISESIKHIIWKNFPEVSSAEQEDIAQEVKYKIWKIISSGKKIDNLRSYIWKVVYTTALDLINKKMKHGHLKSETELDLTGILSDEEDNRLEKMLERKESRATLMKAIENLSQNRRIVIKLSLTGMNINEIADFLGWGKSKVNHLYYRGVTDLKNKLRDTKE